MTDHLPGESREFNESYKALFNNTAAAKAVSRVVEGTIGPCGLDVMLVDSFGGIAVSNDGLTILNLMEAGHPVARMIINAVRSQQAQVGDGTTTTAILAGTLVAEGAARIYKGVPIPKLIAGIRQGVEKAISLINENKILIESVDDKILFHTALIAGRGHADLADLVIKGARLAGMNNLHDPLYKLADAVECGEAIEDRVFNAVIINKEPVNRHMVGKIDNPLVMVINDALGPGKIDNDALKTDSGFNHYILNCQSYEQNLNKISSLGVNVVVLERGIDDTAEEFFTRSGIMVIEKAAAREIERLCEHTGARKVKRNILEEEEESIRACVGSARQAYYDKKNRHVCVADGSGKANCTMLIGAATPEVLEERERMAKDAAASVQAAVQGGVVAGGGAMELWLAEKVLNLPEPGDGLEIHGIYCLREALQKPFLCMAGNAGLNPLKKMGDVIAAQKERGAPRITLDYNYESLIDAIENGIVDPAPVKVNAVKTAAEVAIAVLRINNIIKMKALDQAVLE